MIVVAAILLVAILIAWRYLDRRSNRRRKRWRTHVKIDVVRRDDHDDDRT
jgi:hypothetical protein|nr:hypothetical protein [Sphingomonas bacterium]